MFFFANIMKQINLLLLFFLLRIGNSDAQACPSGWIPFKDELCIKAFTPNLYTYAEAQRLCSQQSSGDALAALAIVKDSEFQVFLANYTVNMSDYLWLGAQYDNNTAQFTWSDGELLTFTNWSEGYPRNTTDTNLCIQLRPPSVRNVSDLDGKWEDTTCLKRNVPLCQRKLVWTLDYAAGVIVGLRDKLQSTEEALQITNEKLHAAEDKLEQVGSQVVPVGSIYVEYYTQFSPRRLWPSFSWEDVTSSYSGLFFRASGAGSAGWGSIQSDCAPRITQMEYNSRSAEHYENPISIPSDGYSSYGLAGAFHSSYTDIEGLRFYTAGCETRPRNQAIRIWKRIQ